MNGALSTTSDNLSRERPGIAAERPGQAPPRESDAAIEEAPKRGARLLRHTAVFVVLLFFAAQFSMMTLSRFMRVPDEGWEVVLPRLIVTICGALFGLFILKVQRGVGRASLFRRILIAAGLAAAGSYVHAAANLLVFTLFFPPDSDFGVLFVSYLFSGLDWLWFYSALSIMVLALTYASDLAESDDRIAALQAQANAAQLKALRYQLNPHFLFNTLNSIAALIGRKEGNEAEGMVVSLSDFLRSTLSMDPGKQIPLGDEVRLQSLYLEIEKARFPARLNVTIDIPEEISDALVPNLITQPLIENAIKYGVARSTEPIHLEVIAREEGGRLSLEIRNDGGNAPDPSPGGTRLGLRNVADRLRLHFGDEASFTAGKLPEGGYSALIQMPLKRA